jgi:sorbitol-specific phosphotransferase system component IIC
MKIVPDWEGAGELLPGIASFMMCTSVALTAGSNLENIHSSAFPTRGRCSCAARQIL